MRSTNYYTTAIHTAHEHIIFIKIEKIVPECTQFLEATDQADQHLPSRTDRPLLKTENN
jgi:hypothetical protein